MTNQGVHNISNPDRYYKVNGKGTQGLPENKTYSRFDSRVQGAGREAVVLLTEIWIIDFLEFPPERNKTVLGKRFEPDLGLLNKCFRRVVSAVQSVECRVKCKFLELSHTPIPLCSLRTLWFVFP